MQSAGYKDWCERLRVPPATHRKLWEWCYIMQSLQVAGMIRPGRRGIGFGVGVEPLTPSQIAKAMALVEFWAATYPTIEAVVTHADVAPHRKTDPLKSPGLALFRGA